MTLASFGSGQVLWSLLWLALFVLWAGLFFSLFVDIVRADVGGWAKATWTLALLVLPLLGAFLYLIVHGDDMSDRLRGLGRRRASEPLGGTPEHESFRLAALHDAGLIDDAEYAAAEGRLRR